MTNLEAAKILEEDIPNLEFEAAPPEYMEAFRMAIAALKEKTSN